MKNVFRYHSQFSILNFQFSILNFQFSILLLALLLCASCSKDDEVNITEPSATGTFVDERDGTEYRYITVGGLDWLAENLRYDLGDIDLSRDYQSEEAFDAQVYSTANRARFGMLYSYSGALQAVPEGWRLPTDADWTALEQQGGYLSEAFALLYGGYYTKNTNATASNGNRFMGSWAYFWTSTKDGEKQGEYYWARKKFYSEQELVRLSIQPDAYFLSVRLVREH